ncbi:MAG: tRNA 2-selenouridine(34) synthase MnmH [Betaproteobacteria bacterium]|nr:tRNA 2-selenouridine(34) synthase MnmH [Betaproteobacteria bacterium]
MRHDLATIGELEAFDTVIDVRSPSEFAEDHVPGAISCPVLDDGERARVGTLYKQVSPFEARKVGAAIVARNIAGHIEARFLERPRNWRPLVYCWRGGKRSGSMTHILREVGWNAKQLEGGYKAFRRAVVSDLGTLPERLSFRVICGLTGSGKSRLLSALAERGAQVLDLEQAAAHRGSVLGDLPANPQPAQKHFETLLWQALRAFDAACPVYVESESKKIGALHVPDALIARMRASECLRVETDRAARVRLLAEEYAHFFDDPDRLVDRLRTLRPLHGHAVIERWAELVDARDWDTLVAELLERHYDPSYTRSIHGNYPAIAQAAVVRMESHARDAFAEAAARILGDARVPCPA